MKPMNNHKAKVIAVMNQKGGVGKTTTVLNLGVGLARQGFKVLLIDADPQGSLTVSLGVHNHEDLDVTLASVMNTVMEGKLLKPTYGIARHREHIYYVPANRSLSGTVNALKGADNRESVLKTFVDGVRDRYDYILIDCLPSLGIMAINCLVAADSVIIPTHPAFLSTKGLSQLLNTIARVKKNMNPNLQIDGILLTVVEIWTRNARDIIGALRRGIGRHVHIYHTIIPKSVRAAECSNTGVSIFRHNRTGKVAMAYEELVEEVVLYGNEAAQAN